MLYAAFLVLLGVDAELELLVDVVLHDVLQLVLLLELLQFVDHAFFVPEDALGLLVVCGRVDGPESVGELNLHDEVRDGLLYVLPAMAIRTLFCGFVARWASLVKPLLCE